MSALEAITTYFGLPTGIPNDEVLTMMIERACDPRLQEPDIAANLEICDYINKKKQNTPYDVSNFLVQLINHREQKVAMLALVLLDTCVRNCGYAFHLQIARKEFLNELVKKFPEKPPIDMSALYQAFPNSVQMKILEFINEWKLGLASQTRFKHDFRKILELHNILLFKGYKFPTVKPDRISALVSKPVLSSAEELEEEDKEALSAKLQEYIRRGTPSDLLRANEIMKLLSGYDSEKKPDYNSIVDNQLENVERSIELLSSQLIPGVEINRHIQDLYNDCIAAQNKIQKLIVEEEDDRQSERLLKLNDRLNELKQQYTNACDGIFIDEPIRFTENGSTGNYQIPESNNTPAISSLIDLGEDFMTSDYSTAHKANPLNRVQGLSTTSSNGSNLPSYLLDGFESLNVDTPSTCMSATPGPSTPKAIQLDSSDSSPTNLSHNRNNLDLSPSLIHTTGFTNLHENEHVFPESNHMTSSQEEVKHTILLQNSTIKVSSSSYCVDKTVYIQFDFFNISAQRIDNLDLKIAVPKGLRTVITGITGTFLLPRIGHVSLPVEIHFPTSRQEVKYRYILTFTAEGNPISHQGEIQSV